jgi:hypothetical protein
MIAKGLYTAEIPSPEQMFCARRTAHDAASAIGTRAESAICAALMFRTVVERSGQQDGALGRGGSLELGACPPGPAVCYREPV